MITICVAKAGRTVRSMTIEQAIDDLMDASRSIAEVAESESDEANRINAQNVADDCKQLAEWLRELQERRKAPEIVYCHECIHFQCNMRFDGSVPKGADAYECRHWCGGCDPMDYCSYGKRREGRTE